jgi:hypothetical protein
MYRMHRALAVCWGGKSSLPMFALWRQHWQFQLLTCLMLCSDDPQYIKLIGTRMSHLINLPFLILAHLNMVFREGSQIWEMEMSRTCKMAHQKMQVSDKSVSTSCILNEKTPSLSEYNAKTISHIKHIRQSNMNNPASPQQTEWLVNIDKIIAYEPPSANYMERET